MHDHIQPRTVLLLQSIFCRILLWPHGQVKPGCLNDELHYTLQWSLGKYIFKCYPLGSDAPVLESLPQMDSFTQRDSLISLKWSHWFLNAIYVELYSNIFIKYRNIRLYSICNFHTITVPMMQLREITTLGEPGCIWIKISSSPNFLMKPSIHYCLTLSMCVRMHTLSGFFLPFKVARKHRFTGIIRRVIYPTENCWE